jgi:hypothetical protein
MTLSALVTTIPTDTVCAINAHQYPLLSIQRSSLPTQRQQVDTSQEPGEGSLAPFDLWRRTADDWGLGSGQTYFDRNEKGDRAGDAPSRSRFRASLGVNPWGVGELSLLNATTLARASANSGLLCVVAGARLYFADGQTLRYTTDLSSFTSVTGTPASTITTLATDGYTVYIGYGSAQFIYSTNTGTGAASAWGSTHKADRLGFFKNRLIGALGTVLSNFTSTTLSTVLTPTFLTTPTGWTWDAFGEGFSHIYAAANLGDKGMIYGITVTPEGTALTQPTIVGRTLDGENVKGLGFYQGIVFVGTTKGVRVAYGGRGSVQPGPLIATSSSVLCFEPQDSWVWHGLTNYSGTVTGLARLSPADEVASQKLAWATDLQYVGQGTVGSVVTFLNRRVFTVDGVGIVAENTASAVASGTLDTGRITFGVPDRKFFRYVEVNTSSIGAGGSIGVTASPDAGTYSPSVSVTTAGATVSLADSAGDTLVGRDLDLHFVVTRNTDLSSPKLNRWTLRSYPIPRRGRLITLTIDLREDWRGLDGQQDHAMVAKDEYDFLTGLEDTGLPVTFQFGQVRYEALIDSIEQVAGSDDGTVGIDYSWDRNFVQGPLKVTLRVFS